MTIRRAWLQWCVVGSFMISHHAFASFIKCPDRIDTNQSLRKKINGWHEFVDDWNLTHRLNQVTFYAGNPKNHASLAPAHDDSRQHYVSWSFDKSDIWLACGYSNTDVQLIQKLPDNIKHCRVTYKTFYLSVIKINCAH